MFLWTMFRPFSVIEMETQAKPRVLAPPVVAQSTTAPAAPSQAQ